MTPGRSPLQTTGILSTIGNSTRLQGIMVPGGHPHPLRCSPGKLIGAVAGVLLPPLLRAVEGYKEHEAPEPHTPGTTSESLSLSWS